MENYRDDDDNYDDDDGPLAEENADQQGFEKKVKTDLDIFRGKSVDLPGIPTNEKIKRFAVSDETKIVVTESNRIYRWRTRKDPEFIQLEMPDPRGDNIMGILSRGKERQSSIQCVYLDTRGLHCIIST